MTVPGRRLAAGVAAALLVIGAPAAVGHAPEAHAAACSGTSGVTVVVDFRAFGGGVQVGCAAGDPSSGLAALSGAGFGYAFVAGRLGLVCQINGLPNPCNGAPTSAYWSYWHAQPGGSWSYSASGAGSYNPAPGSVEGWAFGAGSAPGIAPPLVPASPPPPPPAQSPSAQSPPAQPPPAPSPPATRLPPAPPAPAKPAPVQPPATSGQASPSSPAGQASGVPDTSAASAPAVAGPSGAAGGGPDPQPVAQLDPAGGRGGTIGLLAAAALIAALGGLAVWRSRTRRRSAEP